MKALLATSPRRSSAGRVAMEIRRAMAAKGIGRNSLCDQASIPRSNLGYYLAETNLPTVQTARRLAEALDCPRIAQLVLEARRVRCSRKGCAREFVYEGGKPKLYCSEDCRALAAKMRVGEDPLHEGAKRLYDVVRAELDRKAGVRGGVPKAPLEAALEEYARSGSKRHAKLTTLQRRVDAMQAAVDEMCRGCEPEGLCRQADCALRHHSPLPLEGRMLPARPTPAVVHRPDGPWGGANRERMLETVRRSSAERWARPGERERMSAASRRFHDGMTEEERADWRESISAGRSA